MVAVCTGVLAGAAAGLVLFVLGERSQMEFVEGESISIILEKREYMTGEPIHMKIVNSGSVPLTVPNGDDGLKVTQLDGIIIHADLMKTADLEPGGVILVTWDQKKESGEAVMYGTYRITAQAVGTDDKIVGNSITVNILK